MTLPSSSITFFSCIICCLLFLRIILSLDSIFFLLRRLSSYLHQKTNSFQTYKIPQHDDVTSAPNPLYNKALAYVTSLPSVEDASNSNIFSTGKKANELRFRPDLNQTISDRFKGFHLYWTLVPGCLLLRVRHVDRHRVLRPYLHHVESLHHEPDLKLYVPDGESWKGISFTHPATFETLAMDADLINKVKSDLDQFSKGRSYYNSRGRVWKRSYLLHGPSGTGKTTFAAAMAKHLCYDMYSFDHTTPKSMLLKTGPKALILIEDFDKCSDLSNMVQMLDFIGEEKVVVFTTRGGNELGSKMDMHVEFTSCDFEAFKSLAGNYLGVKEHKLYGLVEEGFGRGGKVSHAEVAEIMVVNRASPSRAIKSVISVLNKLSERFVPCADGEDHQEIEGCGGGNGLFGKDATVREIKKLYGFIRRSGSRREGTMSVEMAAAAAAAAAAAVAVKGGGSEWSSGSVR